MKETELEGSNRKLVNHNSISDVPKITGSAPKAYIPLIVLSVVIIIAMISMAAGFSKLKSCYANRK